MAVVENSKLSRFLNYLILYILICLCVYRIFYLEVVLTEKTPHFQHARPKGSRLLDQLILQVLQLNKTANFRGKSNSPLLSFNKDAESENPKKPTNILIVTEYRSGSSFFANVFNKNSKAFYLFEPLVLANENIKPNKNKHSNKTAQLDFQLKILTDFFKNCDLQNTNQLLAERVTSEVWNGATKSEQNFWKYCKYNNMCFRSSSNSFRRQPFCVPEQLDDRSFQSILVTFFKTLLVQLINRKGCNRVDVELAKTECFKKYLRVAKVIRFTRLRNLKKIEELIGETKVIYLVRDPRGLASSRMALHKNTKQDEFDKICSRYRSNLEYLNSENSDWLRKKLTVIRFEDFAVNPNQFISDLYSKFDLEKSQQVSDWFKSATDQRIAPSFERKDDAYLTFRNSSEIVENWKNKLDWGQVKIIQGNCGDVFDKFGYKLVEENGTGAAVDLNWSENSIFEIQK